jgi:hypothetical protein
LASPSGASIGGGLGIALTGLGCARESAEEEVHMNPEGDRERIESRNTRLSLGPLNARDRGTGHTAGACKLLLGETGALALAS